MKIRFALIMGLVALSSVAVNAQDAKEIERTYRKQENVYQVDEELWMTPSYSEDGQVCMMRIVPRTISHNTNYLDRYVNVDAALKFLTRTFPINMRGPRKGAFGMSDIGGGVIWTKFEFENVQFVFVSSYDKSKMDFSKAKSEISGIGLDFPIADEAAMAEAERKEDMKSDDQIIKEHVFNPQVLEILWSNRKCPKL